MTFHKKCKACIFHRIIFVLANLYSKDVGPWKLKWAPKFQNLGAHLAPKIFNKVSPLPESGPIPSLDLNMMHIFCKIIIWN